MAAPLLMIPAEAPGSGSVSSFQAAPQLVDNPTIEESCGVDITVVLDASGSIQSSDAVEDVRDAADALLSALTDTNSTARVTQFATLTEQLAARTVVDRASMGTGGALREAINDYYDPQPQRPAGTTIRSYDGSGNPLSAGNYNTANSSIQFTNWDASLDQAGQGAAELVMYVTDGDPTAFDFGQPNDPFPAPDVAVNTDRSSESSQITLNRAVQEADQIKGAGTRILAVGVGNALDNTSSRQRLQAISGPQVVRDADLANIDSLNDVDVALVTDFDKLADFMRAVVIQLCSPSLTIRKMAQTSTDAGYLPAQGWDMTVTPTVPGGTFDWILPNTTPATSKTVPTNADGFAQFQWEPDPADASSEALVEETLEPDYTAGRPGADNDFRCELRNEDGDVREVEDDFADPSAPSFTLDPIEQEIVTCTVYNSFDYAPDIEVTKVNDPTSLRGDLDPAAEVTSSYVVTNPGNTPLDIVSMTDLVCGLITPAVSAPNPGDTAPRNGLLDPGEAWEFECERPIQTPDSTDPDGETIPNTVTVEGVAPDGTIVSDDATADVVAFNPAIELVKLVDGEDLVVVPLNQEVEYTYEVTNAGNTPLGTVELVDDTPPCESPDRGLDNPGNNDQILDVGETWTYSCVAPATESVINTADVEAVPLDPLAGNTAFPDPNPPVTATDTAEVQVVNPSIELTKSVEPNVVLLDPGTPITPEPVTYTFEAENTGDDVLNRPGATTGGPGPTEPGWVVDGRCESDATFVGGDTNGNELLDPGETWEFTCDGEVTGKTVNIAEITGQPSDAQGQPLPVGPVFDLAAALVQVLQPDIELTKIPLRGVVLDEDVVPIAGPDTPDVRPAQYLYQVTNPGNVPLSLTPNPPVDDKCGPLDFVDGDTNGDELLGPDEVWGYECETTLDREDDSNSPPVTGDESGLVRNTVTVVGVPFFEGALVPAKQVTDTDTALVQVIEPGIEITKRASAAVVTGGTAVTYTFRVRNTGDVGLTQVAPQDDKCAPLELVRGDNGNDILEGANTANPETWIYECTRIIGMPEPPATTDVNQVSVTGLDPLGNTYGDTASAEVRVIEPAIDLTKTVSESLVPAGTTVSYEFLVTNAGTSPIPADDVLADTALLDLSAPNIPACDSPTLIAKEGGNQDQFLDRVPAETWRYGCDAPITEPTTNVAFVRAFGGTQFGLRLRVLDLDAAFVQPFHPGIEVEKSAEPKTLLGPGEVTYTYRVRNTGDVPLAGVKEGITDDTCSPVTYVRGDTDGDNLLDTPTSIFEDSADEVWIFTCTTTLDETTTNTVVVPGTPVDPGGDPLCGPDAPDALRVDEPCDTSDRDRAKVRVIDPAAINVTKATTSDTSTTFPFSLGGVGFRLGDGETRAFADLMPGRYKLTEAATQDWRLDDLVCEDSSGDTVVSVDGSEAMIELAEGETVSCTFTNEFTGQVGPVEPPGPQEPPDTGGLPGTGAPPWVEWLLALGVLLVLAGGVLIARNHPRRSRSLS